MPSDHFIEAVDIQARVSGPPVASCFGCERTVSLDHISWYGELSASGPCVALLPYCQSCVLNRECKQAEQRLKYVQPS